MDTPNTPSAISRLRDETKRSINLVVVVAVLISHLMVNTYWMIRYNAAVDHAYAAGKFEGEKTRAIVVQAGGRSSGLYNVPFVRVGGNMVHCTPDAECITY